MPYYYSDVNISSPPLADWYFYHTAAYRIAGARENFLFRPYRDSIRFLSPVVFGHSARMLKIQGECHFKILCSPTKRLAVSGKIIPIMDADGVADWLARKIGGGNVVAGVQVEKLSPVIFTRRDETITMNRCEIIGVILVENAPALLEAITTGFGRGKAFGFGTMEVV